eukprot:gene32307-43474_t
MWGEAVRRTEESGARSSRHALGNGTANVKEIAERAMAEAADRLADRIEGYVALPATAVRQLVSLFTAEPASGTAAWIHAATCGEGFPQGVTAGGWVDTGARQALVSTLR